MDQSGLWANSRGRGEGWYSFTEEGRKLAQRLFPGLKPIYPQLQAEQIVFQISSPSISGRVVSLDWAGGAQFEVALNGELRPAKKVCAWLARVPGYRLPAPGGYRPRVLWDVGVREGWEAKWLGPGKPPPPPPPPEPLTAKERKAIEMHAMKVAAAHYRLRMWDVKDTSADHPYDLECRSGDRILRVEVKGTTGDGSTVNLTAGEVRNARLHPSALFVLHNIELERGDKPLASGGIDHILEPWTPYDDDLRATQYRYGVPGLA